MDTKYNFLEDYERKKQTTQGKVEVKTKQESQLDWKKILMAAFAVLLLICWMDLPRDYYRFIRMAATVLFSTFAFGEFSQGNTLKTIIYAGLVILFQPFEKITMEKGMWNIIDTVVAAWLIYNVVKQNKK